MADNALKILEHSHATAHLVSLERSVNVRKWLLVIQLENSFIDVREIYILRQINSISIKVVSQPLLQARVSKKLVDYFAMVKIKFLGTENIENFKFAIVLSVVRNYAILQKLYT